MTESGEKATSGLATIIGKYLKLLIEDTRLNIAEKLTRLLSAITIFALLLITGSIAIVFISLWACYLLSEVLPQYWSFLIVAGFYIILFFSVYLLKKGFFLFLGQS